MKSCNPIDPILFILHNETATYITRKVKENVGRESTRVVSNMKQETK